MASKEHKLPGFLNCPERDYCTGRLLSVANELAAMGYKHRIIAYAGLSVGLTHSKENPEDALPFLELIEQIGRESAARITAAMEEKDAAEKVNN